MSISPQEAFPRLYDPPQRIAACREKMNHNADMYIFSMCDQCQYESKLNLIIDTISGFYLYDRSIFHLRKI